MLTLDQIQARHRRMRDELDALDPGLSGAVVADGSNVDELDIV
jgi:hypothetical protein